MATDSIQVSAVIPASPEAVYSAWLDSEAHSRMTGGAATIDAIVGGKHSAWDGYISGEIVALEPGRRIVQTWRTSEFPDGSGHSRLEITLIEEESGTRVALDHSEIPEGQGEKYLKGWDEHYFKPLLAFFGAPAKAAKKGAAKKGAAKKAAPKKAAKKAAAKKTAKKGAAKKGAAKKGAAKKTAKKGAAKKGAAKKAAPKKTAAKKGAAKKGAAKKGAAKKAAAKKAAPKKAAAKKSARKAAPAAAPPPAAAAPNDAQS